MKIIQILPDHRTKVLLADGRLATLSPLNKSQTRKIILENGQEIGIIQKLYVTPTPQIVYLITEGQDKNIKIYLEFLDDPDDIWLEDKSETYMELLDRHHWILEVPDGAEVFEKLTELSTLPGELDKLLITIQSKDASTRSRGISSLHRLLILIEKPANREKPNNLQFWLDSCLPLIKQLGIKI